MRSLIRAVGLLILDLASTLVFLAVLLLTGKLVTAVVSGMAFGAAQIAWRMVRRQPIDLMQWMSLILVLGSGAASLLTHNPRFVMMKPSVIYAVVGLVMLRPGWMNRYLPPEAIRWVADLGTLFGYAWAGLMFATAALNLVLAWTLAPAVWAAATSTFAIASKLVLLVGQFAVMRFVGRRRARAEALAGA
jgi:intracellular septation protein A